MKRNYICILTLIIICIFSVNVYAQSKDNISNLFLFSNKVSSNEDISGDIYAFAKEISIDNSNVGGDVISAGQDISVNSKKIKGDIRVAGQNVNITKYTNCNSIYSVSQDLNFEGSTKNLYAKAENIVIKGTVNGTFDVECENLTISEDANLLGDINIKSPNEASIYGNHNLENMNYEKVILNENSNLFRIIPILTSFTSAILIGILIFTSFKNYFNNCNKIASLNIGRYILFGLCVFILFPVLFLLLCISIIGIPVAIILLLIYIVMLYLSHIVVGIVIGKFILKGYNPYIQLIAGIFIIKVLMYIPFIGFMFGLCSILFTLGLIALKLLSIFK
ncbi:MAG: hypothetical protein RR942_18595 [Romboutsia sp.]